MSEAMTCSSGAAVQPIVTTQTLLDMFEALHTLGTIPSVIEITPEQYAQLKNDPDILRYVHHEGWLSSFAGVQLKLVDSGEQI